MPSAESSGFPPDSLCCRISLARCRAQESPAGPAPTMSTSASSRSRSGLTPAILATKLRRLLFFEDFGECGDKLENIADDAVVGDFKDGGVPILVDGHDRS